MDTGKTTSPIRILLAISSFFGAILLCLERHSVPPGGAPA